MGVQSSRLRQKIGELAKRYQAILHRILSERGPLIRGSFGTRRRVCGACGCRCARGELHASKYLTATDEGRVRQVHVPAAGEAEVAEGVTRYREFFRARAELAELARLQSDLVENLGQSLLKPYPPDRPLPPAQRRGRRSGRRGHDSR